MNKLKKTTRLIFVVLLVSISFVMQGQKVALVLSGGGAKGVTHVGVLKALEEHNIPIDYIAGTSMGAIVGGFYASGYSPEEIEAIITSDEFLKWATASVDENNTYLFKKNAPDASWVNINFKIDKESKKLKTKLPTNIIEPSQLDLLFLDFFAASAAVANYDFDSLFVPFRCVAADINADQAITIKEGQLSEAIRASMTFPFFFRPIRIDDKLLFDGGLYNNFPVDVALEEFHPDVIIGSKSVANYSIADEDDLMSLIQNMIVTSTDFTMPVGNSVLIEPDLPKINFLDFSKSQAFIDSGYLAAVEQMPAIESLIQRRINPETRCELRDQFNQKKLPVIIDTVIINGLKKNQQRYVSRLLKQRSKYLTLNTFREEYFKLLSDDNIKNVYPALKNEPGSPFYSLNLDIQQADKFNVLFGGNLSSSAASAAFIGLSYRNFASNALEVYGNAYIGRFYSSGKLMLRGDFTAPVPFYLKIDYTYNHKDYFKNTIYFFEDSKPSYLIQNESHLSGELGIPAGTNGKVYGQYASGYVKDEYYQTNTFTKQDTSDVTYFDFLTPGVFFEINTFNRKQYADKGMGLFIGLKYIGGREKTIPGSTSEHTGETFFADHSWFRFKLVYDAYLLKFGHATFGFYSELLLSNQGPFQNYTATMLMTPAFEPIPEMTTFYLPNYRANNFAAIGLKGIFNVFKQLNIRLEGYVFQPYEEFQPEDDGSVSRKKELSNRSVILSAALVYHLPIGPVSLSFNYYDRAEDDFSVMFNIGYILFNKGAYD